MSDSTGTGGRPRRGSERRDDNDRGSASALRHGLRVLEAFSIDKPVLGVTEIAQHVGLHKSTVSRILVILEQGGYVERDAESGRFRLGLELIALAGPLLADLDVRRAARPAALEQLTVRTGETSALVVWNGHEAVVIEQVPSPRQVKHTAALGTRYDTYQSASVQIFLAQLPAGAAQQLFERRLVGGPYDVGPPDGLFDELDRVRVRGYAVNDGQTSVEEVGIAAPVYDHRGAVAAGVLLSAPRFRVPAGMLEPLGKAVASTAQEVSGRLGYRPRALPGQAAGGTIADKSPPPTARRRLQPYRLSGEAAMEEHFVWVTTRQIRPGALAGFEGAWRPGTHPEGMLRAYAYWSEDETEVVGVSFWDSKESCEAGRASEAEARRRAAMAPHIVAEQEAFYRGRELAVPTH